jgi:hypothetical protein
VECGDGLNMKLRPHFTKTSADLYDKFYSHLQVQYQNNFTYTPPPLTLKYTPASLYPIINLHSNYSPRYLHCLILPRSIYTQKLSAWSPKGISRQNGLVHDEGEGGTGDQRSRVPIGLQAAGDLPGVLLGLLQDGEIQEVNPL